MNKPLNIKEMSVSDLKALAYDQLLVIEQAQNNLKVVNQEIASRVSESPKEFDQNIIAEIPVEKKGN